MISARPAPASLQAPVRPLDPAALPDHLIALPGDAAAEFALWRTVALRAAGLPVEQVLELAEAECAAAADRRIAAEDEAEQRRQAALEAARQELAGTREERPELIRALRRLRRGKVPAREGLAAETASAIEAWQAAARRAVEAEAAYRLSYAAAQESLGRKLARAAREERFREALLWQNRQAASTALASALRRAGQDGGKDREGRDGRMGRSRHDRGHDLMLASYLQRYGAKNDTIGFFGPVGWARLTEGEPAVTTRPGPGLVAQRNVFLEGWAIDALVDALAADEALRPWLAPRRTPLIRRKGSLYILPDGGRALLGPTSTALLAACDGERPAREVVAGVLAAPALRNRGEAELYGLLADLRERGLITWTFQIPLSLHPERRLRDLLLRVGDAALRERGLALLDELEAARDAVAAAAGRPEELDRALADLEARFTRMTGIGPTRAHGKIYSGRTLVWEDCRRDLEVELGRPFLEELAPPLSLVLLASRWYTEHAAAHHRTLLGQVHDELRQKQGTASVDLLSFLRRALDGMLNKEAAETLQQELYTRWARVLDLPPGERRVHFRSADLRPRVLYEFAAEGPGWQKARYHSPDLLVAAAGVEALRRGDYEVVLGEIHLAVNTIDLNVFLPQHPDPERLRAEIEADLPEPSIIPSLPKIWREAEIEKVLGFIPPAITGRLELALQSPKDFYLQIATDPADVPASQTLPIAEMVVEPGAGGLVVGPRDGRVRFDVIEFFQLILKLLVVKTFKILPPAAHTPRITVDRLVLTRESWSLPVAELAFAHAATPEERFAGARRWAREHGMPRFVFFKAPPERKPLYLDFESPLSVEILAKVARRAAVHGGSEPSITVSEMLPEPGRAWVPDAQGHRYTSELRLVAVDLR